MIIDFHKIRSLYRTKKQLGFKLVTNIFNVDTANLLDLVYNKNTDGHIFLHCDVLNILFKYGRKLAIEFIQSIDNYVLKFDFLDINLLNDPEYIILFVKYFNGKCILNEPCDLTKFKFDGGELVVTSSCVGELHGELGSCFIGGHDHLNFCVNIKAQYLSLHDPIESVIIGKHYQCNIIKLIIYASRFPYDSSSINNIINNTEHLVGQCLILETDQWLVQHEFKRHYQDRNVQVILN